MNLNGLRDLNIHAREKVITDKTSPSQIHAFMKFEPTVHCTITAAASTTTTTTTTTTAIIIITIITIIIIIIIIITLVIIKIVIIIIIIITIYSYAAHI